MKKYIFTAALASTLLATSCSDSEGIENVIPNGQKEKISFSLSDGSAQTRAGFTGGETFIEMRIQSDKRGSGSPETKYTRTTAKANVDGTGTNVSYSTVSFDKNNNEVRYWDDAHGRYSLLSVYAVAVPNKLDDSKVKNKLQNGDGTDVSTVSTAWGSHSNNNITWSVDVDQSAAATINSQDLVYSNNIQQDGTLGVDGVYRYDFNAAIPDYKPGLTGKEGDHYNGRMLFFQDGQNINDPLSSSDPSITSAPGKFDRGHLVFKHALSRITVTLKEGEGFDEVTDTDADFKFKTNTNVSLIGMPISGTLDVKTGTWDIGTITNGNITLMSPSESNSGTNANGDYLAQILPNYKFYKSSNTNVMQYVIDDNTYYVTQAQIYKALDEGPDKANLKYDSDANGDYIIMEQQKNYKLTITVKKTGIANITATLADWVKVSGSTAINNAHLSFSMTASGTACDKNIDIYRLADINDAYDENNYDFSYQGTQWFGNYTDKQTLMQASKENNTWRTNWFFESNKIYYHFRTVNSGTVIKGSDNEGVNDYFEIAAGSISATDPHWGAPMRAASGANPPKYLKYDVENGYGTFLYPAIGATESTIAIQEIHMMSNIKVILKTPNDGGKVTLKDGDKTTKIKITRIAKDGIVEMGRGLVKPVETATYTDELTMDAPLSGDYFTTSADGMETTKEYTYAVVPQILSRNFYSDNESDYVGLFIQTPDNNQYYVVKALSKIKATSVDNDERDQAVGEYIQRWYPGHTYIYTITISKKGIESVTCTVANWVEVKGENIDIDLES